MLGKGKMATRNHHTKCSRKLFYIHEREYNQKWEAACLCFWIKKGNSSLLSCIATNIAN